MSREVLDWAGFGAAVRELAAQVAADGYRPDVVLSIARGGLLVGGALGYALGVKPSYLINVEYYTGVDRRLDRPVVLPPDLNLDAAHGAKILIADDVADTGHTLALVKERCEEAVSEARIAVLYEKPTTAVRCEYVWRHTDRWIDFPWSSQPALTVPTPSA